MKQYGIIGFPLSHSFSPAYFNKKFAREQTDAIYTPFSLEHISLLPQLIKDKQELRGLNVTIPYKTAVIPYLDAISAAALKINAVNCIRIVDGKLTGFNTDYFGFSESLKPLLGDGIDRALVLGSGGSSKAVCYALNILSIGYSVVSSSGKSELSYTQLTQEILEQHHLIINTTPLGMFPAIDGQPDIPYQFLNETHLLFDLVYNPPETRFLQQGKAHHSRTENGLNMLISQAERGFELWQNNYSDAEIIVLK